MGDLNSWFEENEDRADFRLVYVREAHPGEQPVMKPNLNAGISIADHQDLDDRQEAAQVCAAGLDIVFPIVVDGMDNFVEQSYAAHPDRIYIIGADGLVAYNGGPGPDGFKPDEAAEALDQLLADS